MLAAMLGYRSPNIGETRQPHRMPPQLPSTVLWGSLAINFLALAIPLVILQIYDRIIPHQALDTLAVMMAGLIVVMILDAALKMSRAYLVAWTAARYEHELGVTAVNRVLSAPASAIEREPPGAQLDRLNAIETLRDFHGGQARLLALDLPFVAIFLILIFVIGGILVLIPLGLFAVLMIATLLSGAALRRALEQRSTHDDRRYNFTIEVLNGIHSIKALTMEPQMQRRYERLLNASAGATHRVIILAQIAQTFGALFSSLTMVSVVGIGAIFVIQGSLSIGALAASTLLSGRAIQPLLKGLTLWTQQQTADIAQMRMDGLFSLPADDLTSAEPIEKLAGIIELRDVHAQPANEAVTRLAGINLKISAGEMIGITGKANGGKSTLARLIAGELAPSSGRILIDGMESSGPHRSSLSKWIAYVPSTPVMFRGTILENLTLFEHGAAIGRARRAAQLIGLERDIYRLANGYDTQIGESATECLPGGYLQRIAIARAIARHPKLLILDQANGMLDFKSEAMLREALLEIKGGLTIILISQRPSLIRLADRQFKMEGGRLEPLKMIDLAAHPDVPRKDGQIQQGRQAS